MRTRSLLFSVALVAVPGMALSQSSQPAPASSAAPSAAEGKAIFAALKSLSGTWIGTLGPGAGVTHEMMSDSLRLTMRVLSRGNTLVHEMHSATEPEDPAKYDHPITVIYLNDDGKLTLTHFCDAGNRPRMTARISADGKTIDFDFVDISGRHDRTGYMQHATFTLLDADHHTEEWTYLLPNNQAMRASMALHRAPVLAAAGGR